MLDQLGEVTAIPVALPDRLLEGVEGQVGAQRAAGLPADDRPREHVDVADLTVDSQLPPDVLSSDAAWAG